MLQKVDKDRLDKVLELIKKRGLRFPVVEIHKATKADKGMISNYLNGKKPISNKFYSTFMKIFDDVEEINNNSIHEPTGGEALKDKIILQLVEQNGMLVRQADKLIDNTMDLTQMAKAKFIADAAEQSQSNGPSIVDKILEAAALIGSGKKWPTKEAAEQALRTVVYGDQRISKENTYVE